MSPTQDSHLNRTSGIVGQCHLAKAGFGLSALGLRLGTEYCLMKLCLIGNEPAKGERLLSHIRRHVELVCVAQFGNPVNHSFFKFLVTSP